MMQLLSLAEEIENLILTCVPQSHKVAKYGGTLFTVYPDEKEGQFCGVFIRQNHVQLSFSQGAKLKDDKYILRGTGKYRRHVNITSRDKIDFAYIERLLVDASDIKNAR